MAAPLQFRIAKQYNKLFANFTFIRDVSHGFPGVKRAVKVGTICAALFTKPTTDTKIKLEEPNASTLSWEYKIKSSTNATSEHACTLLTQAALALKDTNKRYAETIFALVILMEYRLKVLGNRAEEERIWDLILEARNSVSELKKKKQLLEMTVSSAQSLVNTSAELAYFIGEDLMGSVAGDRLNKVELFLRDSQAEGEQAETKLRDIEAKTVEVEGKYAEDLEKAGKLDELVEEVTNDEAEKTAESSAAGSGMDSDANVEAEADVDDVQQMYEVFRGPSSESYKHDVVEMKGSGLVDEGDSNNNVDISDAQEISDKFKDMQKPDMAEEITN